MRKYSYDELIRLNNITKYCSVIHKDAILNAMCASYIYLFIDNENITYEQKHKLQDLLRKIKHFDISQTSLEIVPDSVYLELNIDKLDIDKIK